VETTQVMVNMVISNGIRLCIIQHLQEVSSYRKIKIEEAKREDDKLSRLLDIPKMMIT